VGRTDISVFNPSDERMEARKFLKNAPKCLYGGRAVSNERRFFSLNRASCFALALLFIAPCLHPIAGHSQQSSDSLPKPQFGIRPSGPEGNRDKTCKIVYLGIVGGTEPANNKHSGVVQIRDVLRGPAYPGVCAKSYSPYFWRSGFHWILTHFPSHPGRLTSVELERAPKVILVGHSFGGWGVLSVARNLNRKGIPVELCVQIDSVGITDHTVPSNVKAAAIFHANDAMFLLTTKKIKLEDPSQTKLVENVLVKGAGHWSVTRDPRIKDLVLRTVNSLSSTQGQIPSLPLNSASARAISSSDTPRTGQ
jgi:hypothetical protein